MRMDLLDQYCTMYKTRNYPTPKQSKDVYHRLSEIWIQLTDNERKAITIRLFQEVI